MLIKPILDLILVNIDASRYCEDTPCDDPAIVRCRFTPRQVALPCRIVHNMPSAVSLKFSLCKNHPGNVLKSMFLGLYPKDAGSRNLHLYKLLR